MARLPVNAYGTAEAVLVSRPLRETFESDNDGPDQVMTYGSLTVRGSYSVRVSTLDSTLTTDAFLRELHIAYENEVAGERVSLGPLEPDALLVLLDMLETIRDGGLLS